MKEVNEEGKIDGKKTNDPVIMRRIPIIYDREQVLSIDGYDLRIFYALEGDKALVTCCFVLGKHYPVIFRLTNIPSKKCEEFIRNAWLPTVRIAIEMKLLYPKLTKIHRKNPNVIFSTKNHSPITKGIDRCVVVLAGNEQLRLKPFPGMNAGHQKRKSVFFK